MTQISERKKIMKNVEIVFDFLYLFTVMTVAAILYFRGKPLSLRWQFGLMTLVLGLGDSFHLIPRIYSMLDKSNKDHSPSLGVGKFITSITMTIFYIFLWEIGKSYYSFNISIFIDIFVYSLAIVRIVLCFFSQNKWLDKQPPTKWAIIRNIPFFVLGMIVMFLYMWGAFKYGGGLSFMWLAIFISFAFYMPVILFARINPKVGMLMLPKSLAYVAIVLMGFSIT